MTRVKDRVCANCRSSNIVNGKVVCCKKVKSRSKGVCSYWGGIPKPRLSLFKFDELQDIKIRSSLCADDFGLLCGMGMRDATEREIILKVITEKSATAAYMDLYLAAEKVALFEQQRTAK